MSARVLLAMQVALLAATSGVELRDKRVRVNKCCDVYDMLSADGESCVEAHWQGNFSINSFVKYGIVFPPQEREWVRRWLPSGLPIENINEVYTNRISYAAEVISPVNASSLWNPALLEKKALLRNNVSFSGDESIARPRPGGGYREAWYCVDAAPPPLGPFAVQVRTDCSPEECAYKCCWNGQSMRNINGTWKCENDAEGVWRPQKTSFPGFDPEFPYSSIATSILRDNFRLETFEEHYAEWARHSRGSHDFHFSTWHTCFDFYRSSNGTLHEGVFVCEYSRITRGVYWLLRPLCFLSALLLTASLVSVACDKNMRQKIHGRCLASHAACLLVFNIGQTVYYLTISDLLDEREKQPIPAELETVCKNFGEFSDQTHLKESEF